MNRLVAMPILAALALAACGDNEPPPPMSYTDPTGGQLRLIKNPTSTEDSVVLDLVVGDAPLTGYATGFDLALDTTRVILMGFNPGTALSPGSEPVAARAMIPTDGPLAGMLVAAQSQKSAGAGAVTTDTTLAPATVLFTIRLGLAPAAPAGLAVVFDGTAPGFVLASGGLRNRAGLTVVDAPGVAIGKLEVFVGAGPD